MKTNGQKVYMKHLKVYKTKAGESFDVGNITHQPGPAPGGWFARKEIG